MSKLPPELSQKFQIVSNFLDEESCKVLQDEAGQKFVLESFDYDIADKEAIAEVLRDLKAYQYPSLPYCYTWQFSEEDGINTCYVVRQFIEGLGIHQYAEDHGLDYFDFPRHRIYVLPPENKFIIDLVKDLSILVACLEYNKSPYHLSSFNPAKIILDDTGKPWIYGLAPVLLPKGIEVIGNDIMGDHDTAPEIELGQSGFTPASAVFSLACFLLRLMSGGTYETFSCARSNWNRDLFFASNDVSLTIDLPVPLDLFVRQMLDPNPAKRPTPVNVSKVLEVISETMIRLDDISKENNAAEDWDYTLETLGLSL